MMRRGHSWCPMVAVYGDCYQLAKESVKVSNDHNLRGTDGRQFFSRCDKASVFMLV